MTFHRFSTTLVAFALMLFGRVADAGLISMTDPHFGSDSLTLDTDTNLLWLDLTHSTNRSFNSVSASFGPGGDYEGYRYASLAEVDTLFRHAGFPITDGTFRPADLAAATQFINLFGITDSSPRGDTSQGLVNTFHPSNSSPYVLSAVFEVPPFQNPSAGYALGQDGIDLGFSPTIGPDVARPFTGSFLVRAVPEPSSLFLMFVGAAFLVRRGLLHKSSRKI